MLNRRMYLGVTTADLSMGFIRFVEPQYVREQFYMLGDHGAFCPVQFR